MAGQLFGNFISLETIERYLRSLDFQPRKQEGPLRWGSTRHISSKPKDEIISLGVKLNASLHVE